MKKIYNKLREKLIKRSASPAETTRLLPDLRAPQTGHKADPMRRARVELSSVVSSIRRPRRQPTHDLGLSDDTVKSFRDLMNNQQYNEACQLICSLEERGDVGGNMEYLRIVSQKMWEAVSKALTGDKNQIQSMPRYLKWTKKNQSGTNPDWGQQQWTNELEDLFDVYIGGQVPNLTQKTIDETSLQDHLMKLKCKIYEMVSRLSPLPADLTATYLKCLHVYLLKEVSSLAKRTLGYYEQTLLYKWTTREHRMLYSLHQGVEDFDPMLFEKWFFDNGNKILASGQEAARESLKEILQREILWNCTPRADSQHCFSDIQMVMTDICEAAQGLGDTLESRLRSALWEELSNFLSRYTDFLTYKIDKSDGMISGNGVLMGLWTIKNSYILRDTLRNLGKVQPEPKILELLDRCENKGTDVVLRALSPSIKGAFKKYFRKNSHEYENILQEYLRTLRDQAMEDMKMFNTVIEHRITTLYIKSCFKYCSKPFQPNQVQSVVRASQRLLDFFSNLDSDTEQLGTNPLKYMAEMLTTKGLDPLKITIGVFLNEHPDLRREHLLAILNIKGKVSGHEKQQLLHYVQARSIFTLENRMKFFEDIDLTCCQYFLCCPCL